MPRDEERLHAYIPAHLKERLKSDDRSQKEVVTKALEIFYGVANGDELAAMQHQLEREQEELAELERREDKLSERREEIVERVAELEEKVESAQETRQTYEESLEEMLEELRADDRSSIFATHPWVEERAREYDKEPEKVLEDAHDRSDLPEYHFERGPNPTNGRFAHKRSSGLESTQGGEGA